MSIHITLSKVIKKNNIVAYSGAIDNDPQNTKPDKINYLEKTISAITNDKNPETAVTKAIG